MDSRERELLLGIDSIVRKNNVIEMIDSMVARIEQRLNTDKDSIMAWEPVPLYLYGESLPDMILSSWIFIIRAGMISGAEMHRHPNSHQRVISFRGNGDLQVWENDGWKSNPLVSDLQGDLESRWASIPTNVWHQVVTSEKNWVVVSFHTVVAEDLIEERPDKNDKNLTHSRRYVGDR